MKTKILNAKHFIKKILDSYEYSHVKVYMGEWNIDDNIVNAYSFHFYNGDKELEDDRVVIQSDIESVQDMLLFVVAIATNCKTPLKFQATNTDGGSFDPFNLPKVLVLNLEVDLEEM